MKNLLLQHFNSRKEISQRNAMSKIGDKVRVSKYKNVFQKEYTPSWTSEIFTDDHVIPTRPVTYKLKDYQDQPTAGVFYE